jgi:hypothetical protein
MANFGVFDYGWDSEAGPARSKRSILDPFADPSASPAAPATGMSPALSGDPAFTTESPSPAPAAQPAWKPPDLSAPAPPADQTDSTTPADNPFTSHVTAVQTAADPTSQATARDALSRNLFQALKAEGHDVSWKGDQLIVDGRQYDVAGATPTTAAAIQPPVTTPPTPTTPTAPAPLSNVPSNAMPGWEQSKWADPNKHDAKYDFGRFMASTGAIGGAGLTDEKIKAGLDYLTSLGHTVQYAGGDTATVDGVELDLVGNYNGTDPSRRQVQWLSTEELAAQKAAGAAGAGSDLSPSYAGLLGAGAGATGADGSWTPGQGTAGTTAADQALANYFAHPESMDAHTVDTAKAQMKDTLAERAASEDEAAKAWALANGISDSKWFASEKNAAARTRDVGMAKANQDVDLQAASTNTADRAKAAAVALQTKAGATDADRAMADWLIRNYTLTQQNEQFGMGYGLDAAKLNEALANDEWLRYQWMNSTAGTGS